MNELRQVKTYSDLSTLSLNNKTSFRLNEINKIKCYFEFEIREREAVIKKLSKYTAALDYTDKIYLIIRIPAGVISASFTLLFSLTTEIIKKLLKVTRKKKKNILELLCLLRVNQIA